jgi:tRNA-intron endonuclease
MSDSAPEMQTISTVFTDKGVVVPARNEANSLYQDGFGSRLTDSRHLVLRPVEVLFLVERLKIAVIDERMREKIIFRELLFSFSEEDPLIWTRYIVYRDLKTRGFVIKIIEGEGVNFLAYERGAYGKRKPRYYIHTIWEGSPKSLRRLTEKLSEAEESDRILRLAVVDRRGEVVYYTLSEMDFSEAGDD